jgi:hypothetical protein
MVAMAAVLGLPAIDEICAMHGLLKKPVRHAPRLGDALHFA